MNEGDASDLAGIFWRDQAGADLASAAAGARQFGVLLGSFYLGLLDSGLQPQQAAVLASLWQQALLRHAGGTTPDAGREAGGSETC
jgi:hypothetical protein